MSTKPPPAAGGDGARIETAGGCLLLVFSQFGGALVLGVLALLIAMRESWSFSWRDLAFGIALAGWLLAQRAQREREGASNGGSEGHASMSRGAILSILAAIAVWVAAHAVSLG